MLFAVCVGDQRGDLRRRRRLVVFPAPAVAVAPHFDGIEVAGDGDRLRWASHNAALFVRAGKDELPDVLPPHLLLAASAEFPGGATVQLQRPAFQIFEIDEGVRVLLPLRPGHLVRLLSHLLPGFDVVDGGDHLVRTARQGDGKSCAEDQEAAHEGTPIMSGLSHCDGDATDGRRPRTAAGCVVRLCERAEVHIPPSSGMNGYRCECARPGRRNARSVKGARTKTAVAGSGTGEPIWRFGPA